MGKQQRIWSIKRYFGFKFWRIGQIQTVIQTLEIIEWYPGIGGRATYQTVWGLGIDGK